MARNPLMPFGGSRGLAEPFFNLHREMNRMFDEMMGGTALGGTPGVGAVVSTSMDVSETEKEVRIAVELPGVDEKDIDISLDDDVLTIRGEKRFEQKEEKANVHFMERSYGSFVRSLRLPFSVKPDQVQAKHEKGVLTLVIPKAADQQRRHKIQIQGGTASESNGGQKSQISSRSSQQQTGKDI